MNCEKLTMGEKAIKWMDSLYKVAVVLGSVAMIWAHATFASKQDLGKVSDSINQIEIQIQALNLGLIAQTSERGHLSKEVESLRSTIRDMDIRLRSMERK